MQLVKADANKDISGADCDTCFLCYKSHYCDPYIIVKIGGVEVYRTKTFWDHNNAYYMETFDVGRISKNSVFTFEIWDNDGSDSKDDLIARWDGISTEEVIDEFMWEREDNRVFIHSNWTDDQ